MPYLIDGHNLIPKIPGLSLRAVDDEIELIKHLQAFQRRIRKKIEVYFDKATPGEARTQRYGSITAHFSPEGKTADAAILTRLRQLGGDARTWTVVSSDRQVQAAARAAHARVVDAHTFAQQMASASAPASESEATLAKPDAPLSPEEIDEWLDLFGGKD